MATGGIAGAPGSGGGVPGTGVPSVPGGSATPGSFGAGVSGFMSAFGGKSNPAAMTAFSQTSSFGKGAQFGHAVGLVGSLAMSFTNPSLLGFAHTAYGMYGHAKGLARGGISSGGLTGPPGAQAADGPDPVPSRSFKAKKKAPAPAPAPAAAATPYTETKEYLGGQRRIKGLQGEIAKLGAELEAIRKKRAELQPTARKMVGRIPLVHTELKGQEKGEVKALSKKGRERMLMSHSVPEGARRRAGG